MPRGGSWTDSSRKDCWSARWQSTLLESRADEGAVVRLLVGPLVGAVLGPCILSTVVLITDIVLTSKFN